MKDRSVFVNTREGISLTRFGHFPDILEASTYQRSLWQTGIASPLTPLIVLIRRSKQIVSKHLPKQHLLWLHWLCKASDCVNHRKLWNILTEMGIPDHLTCLLGNWHVGQEVTEPYTEQQIGSKLENDYIKAVYRHLADLTYMQSTSGEMPGWVKHKLESRSLGKMSITTGMQMIPL